jgi:hypothetical protein
MKIQGNFTLKLFREGTCIETREMANTITKAGLAEVTNLMGNVSTPTAFTYLAVGTGTVTATSDDTTLGTETTDSGLERASATVTRETVTSTNDTLQLAKTWTATASKAITELGAFNASSSGVMLGRKVFGAVNVESDDTLELIYKFTLS